LDLEVLNAYGVFYRKMRVIRLSFIQIGRKGVELWPCKDL